MPARVTSSSPDIVDLVDGSAERIDCFRAEIRVWIFPKFAGSSLIIEQKLILTPK
jgi:hypothetical protein